MAHTESDLDFSALCAELRKKEEDLLQAARYGKDLLEERGQLRSDLAAMREEYASLHEVNTLDQHFTPIIGSHLHVRCETAYVFVEYQSYMKRSRHYWLLDATIWMPTN